MQQWKATSPYKAVGIHTDGYIAYEKDIGTKDLIHACCMAHARRGFIDAIKVHSNAQAPDAQLERVVALMDGLFVIEREAREQKLSLVDRHALRQQRAPGLLDELHALLVDRYVKNREQHAGDAQPSMEYIDEQAKTRAMTLMDRLSTTPVGRDNATAYQYLVLEILNFLFAPELINGKPEVRTIDGTERRDLIFTNDSDEHSGRTRGQITMALCSCSKSRTQMISVWRRSLRQRHTLAAGSGGWGSSLRGSHQRRN